MKKIFLQIKSKIRKKIIKLLKFLVFYTLYLWLILLKLISYLRKPKKLDVNIGSFSGILKNLSNWEISQGSFRIRLIFIISGFLLIFAIIFFRLIIVATTGLSAHHHFLQNSDIQRGDIVDRNGNLLAVSLPTASLYARPDKVVDVDSILKNLKIVFPQLDTQKTLNLLQSNKKFVWIKRDITPKQQQDIYNLGIPGLGFEKEQKRIYTYGNLFSHVVGYVSREMQGLAGIEKYFNDILLTQPKNNFTNSTIKLSIDIKMQNILAEEIQHTIDKFKAKAGAGILVDPSNGEILAIVSKPDFDPHYPGKTNLNNLFNMVTQGAYEMGSGMKSLTLAIGLDTNTISMHDAYDLSYMKIGKFKLKDTHPVKGWQSVPQIFLHSSNIGVSQIILEIGKNNIRNYLKKLKLFEKLDIELSERARPLFPKYSRWNDLSLVTMSYGYAISESPAHFMQAMMPVVNGGILYPLTLLKGEETNSQIRGERVFKESTSKFMKKMMRLVVSKGTGSKAEVKGFYIGGKTGTAEKLSNGKYDKTKRLSSFFGIMPASNPKYMLYVIFDEPQGIKTTFGFAGGGWVAAPTAGAIFKKIAIIDGMHELSEDSDEIQDLQDIDYMINNKI